MAAPYVWLVHSHGENNENHTFSTITSPDESHVRKFPNPKHQKFWVSCNDGWSLFSDANHRNFILWNIVQQERRTLPPLMNNFRGSISHCTLTFPPMEPDCMILLSATDIPLIFCLRLGDQQWSEIDYTDEVTKRLNNSLELIMPLRIFSCNGDLYARTRFSKLLLVEKLDPSQGLLVLKSLRLSLPRPPCVFEPEVRGFFAEFEGKIYWMLFRFGVVKEDEEVIDVDVHGLDLSKIVWERIEHVPNLVFFVHETCSFCCRAIEPEIHGNRIYFSSNKILYSYHIGDKTLSAKSSPLPGIEFPYSSFWVMSDQSIIDDTSKLETKGTSEIVNVGVKQPEDEETKNSISHVPFDVAKKVAESVDDFLDFMNLRAFHSVFRSIPIPRHLNKTNPTTYSPWLFLQKGGVGSLIDPVRRDSYLIKLPDTPMSTYAICFAKKGWLLMSGNLSSSHLFNPFTKELCLFPSEFCSLGQRKSRSFMAFSDYPSPDCLALEINKFCEEKYEINCSLLGIRARWRRTIFPSWDEQFKFYDNHPVFCQGEFYLLGYCGKLVSVKLKLRPNGVFSHWNVFQPEVPCSYQQNFLVECNGQLWGVFVGRFGEKVRVFEFKRRENTWTRVENLGNYMIFISRYSSIAAMARIPGMKNRIYFPRFCGETGYDVVFYSLDTNRFHSVGSKDSEVDFYSTRELLNAAWIQQG